MLLRDAGEEITPAVTEYSGQPLPPGSRECKMEQRGKEREFNFSNLIISKMVKWHCSFVIGLSNYFILLVWNYGSAA